MNDKYKNYTIAQLLELQKILAANAYEEYQSIGEPSDITAYEISRVKELLKSKIELSLN